MTGRNTRWGAVALTAALAGCASLAPHRPALDALRLRAGVADSVTTSDLAPGVRLHHLVRNTGPLRVDVLDIDLSACVSIRAMKGGPNAIGRQTTSALLQSLPASDVPLAAVNADFFLFTPPGVPVGALVENGRVIAGPADRPVLAINAANRPYIGPMLATAAVIGPRGIIVATSWNRIQRGATSIVDHAWAQPLDSVARPLARLLAPIAGLDRRANPRYAMLPLPARHDGIALGDTLIITGPPSTAVTDGDTVALQRGWTPVTPHNAVGGFPLLLRDSSVVAGVATDGAESFRGLNPRTVAGTDARGTRLLLVVIDGRRPGFSVGTTTRETAELMLALGATEALNLDGGGSTAMVVRETPSARVRVVNRPSDAVGERPVADALAVLGTCTTRVR